MEDFYLVVRVFWNGQGTQSNSIERYTDFNAARKRFYTILGSDIDKSSVSYEIVTILDNTGNHFPGYTATIDNGGETPNE